MTDLTAQQIEELERLEAALRKEPMVVTASKVPVDGEYDYAVGIDINGTKHVVAEFFGRIASDIRQDAKSYAEFFLAFRNAAKPLLAMVKRLQDICTADDGPWVREALKKERDDLRRQLAERDAEIGRLRVSISDLRTKGICAGAAFVRRNDSAVGMVNEVLGIADNALEPKL
ncbi:MAG TPA: hypothetical protein VND94_00635 [Terriglobia bacterium]|nr:hypothetical protein [Terriglobia bacterium]